MLKFLVSTLYITIYFMEVKDIKTKNANVNIKLNKYFKNFTTKINQS